MSGIGGLFLGQDSVDARDLLSRMSGSLSARGADASGNWCSGQVGMAHRALQITPESVQERQPWWNESRTRCIVFDGRIDNRSELQHLLDLKDARVRNSSDAEIALQLYDVLSLGCAAALLGDFAFAIWDATEQQFHCVRDVMGCRPLFYFYDRKNFMFASEMGAMFATGLVPKRANEGMVGEYLAGRITQREETLWHNVSRVPPAHWISFGAAGLKRTRYWDIEPRNSIRYRQSDEYSQHFLAIFKEAIRARLRCRGGVGAHLSGGFDSSSIVGTISKFHLVASPGATLQTFSNVFPDRPEADETKFISQVQSCTGVANHRIFPRYPDREFLQEQARTFMDIPDFPNGSMGDGVRETARQEKVLVLLTGYAGDHWFWGHQVLYEDYLRSFRFGQLARHFRREEKLGIASRRFISLMWRTVKNTVPGTAINVYRRMRYKPETLWPWIEPAFARRINLMDRLAIRSPRMNFTSVSQAQLYSAFQLPLFDQTLEFEDRRMSRFGLEAAHPYNDRRLIEFAFAVPPDQHWVEGHRAIPRNAMRGILPETVRNRTDKADFSHVFPETLRNVNAKEAFEDLQLARNGWVIAPYLRREYRAMQGLYDQGDTAFLRKMWWLWMTYALELWIRAC